MNLTEAIQQYILDCKVNNTSENTISSYEYFLRRLYNVVGEMPINELNATHVRLFVSEEMGRTNEHTGEPLSSFTINKGYCVVRSFSNWLRDQDLVREAPTDKTKPPRVDDDLPDALTREELDRIMDYLDTRNFRDKVIFEFFLDTGCRLAEVANLTLEDVHITEGWARVFGKGRKEGIVPMGDRLCRDLHMYVTRYRKAPPSVNAFFVSTVAPYHGLTRNGLATMVKRVHVACDIEGKRGAHKLRHTMATQYIANGGDISVLRKVLRHSHITTTQRYVNLVRNDIQEAHARYSPLDNL